MNACVLEEVIRIWGTSSNARRVQILQDFALKHGDVDSTRLEQLYGIALSDLFFGHVFTWVRLSYLFIPHELPTALQAIRVFASCGQPFTTHLVELGGLQTLMEITAHPTSSLIVRIHCLEIMNRVLSDASTTKEAVVVLRGSGVPSLLECAKVLLFHKTEHSKEHDITFALFETLCLFASKDCPEVLFSLLNGLASLCSPHLTTIHPSSSSSSCHHHKHKKPYPSVESTSTIPVATVSFQISPPSPSDQSTELDGVIDGLKRCTDLIRHIVDRNVSSLPFLTLQKEIIQTLLSLPSVASHSSAKMLTHLCQSQSFPSTICELVATSFGCIEEILSFSEHSQNQSVLSASGPLSQNDMLHQVLGSCAFLPSLCRSVMSHPSKHTLSALSNLTETILIQKFLAAAMLRIHEMKSKILRKIELKQTSLAEVKASILEAETSMSVGGGGASGGQNGEILPRAQTPASQNSRSSTPSGFTRARGMSVAESSPARPRLSRTDSSISLVGKIGFAGLDLRSSSPISQSPEISPTNGANANLDPAAQLLSILSGKQREAESELISLNKRLETVGCLLPSVCSALQAMCKCDVIDVGEEIESLFGREPFQVFRKDCHEYLASISSDEICRIFELLEPATPRPTDDGDE